LRFSRKELKVAAIESVGPTAFFKVFGLFVFANRFVCIYN
jgi:hypothetical protein